MNTTPTPRQAPLAGDAPAPATPELNGPVPVLPSAELLRGQKAVAIDHNGSLYRLQTTRQGKLILTK
ncbi:MAG: hemin uptake protein HemP [Hydrogenophaga sp.]|jgi:hemin uptake protein HemP|uniref:hemin uptake protein HemP n=1 Tax=Hydrogenophaga sp. TaxID=1904254 RepID=UPI0026354ECE|nr:hemin uptake protein HemP [Hydrogenophaga sp.]MCV0440026.1 hemin uptake protein HemP [Hydrogenophaga sp.]